MADRDAFDLFDLLGKLNKRDHQAYEKLTDEGKKAAHPLVIMRWLSGTSDPAQIIRLNELVNKYVFRLGPEKSLLFGLTAAACTGRTGRASWLKGPGSASKKLAIEAIADKHQCSTREADQYLALLDADDIVRCAEDAGWTKEELKKLTTELGKDDHEPRGAASKRSKPKK